MRPAELFYSYSHEDENLRAELEKHLSMLKRNGVISSWHDRQITAGSDWSQEIDDHINSADIILLLISSGFLASDYCHEIEMKRALERHAAGEARVIPVILRAVDWKGAAFERLQAFPTDGKPVTTWANIDEAFLDVATGIRKAVEGLVRATPISPSSSHPVVGTVKTVRLLEAAAPTRIPVGHSRQIVGMVSVVGSQGLREALGADDTYSIESSNVKTQKFTVAFPSFKGILEPVPAIVRLNSPDFDPPEQQIQLELSADEDSTLVAFLVKAGQGGTKFLTLHILIRNQYVVSRGLRTEAEDRQPPGGTGGTIAASSNALPDWTVVASLALSIVAYAEAVRYRGA